MTISRWRYILWPIFCMALSGCVPTVDAYKYIWPHVIGYSPTKYTANASIAGKIRAVTLEGHPWEIPNLSIQFGGHILKLREVQEHQLELLGQLGWAHKSGSGPVRLPGYWPDITIRDIGTFDFRQHGVVSFYIEGGVLIDPQGHRFQLPMTVQQAKELFGPYKHKETIWDIPIP